MIGSPDDFNTPIYSDDEDQLRNGRIAPPNVGGGLPPVTARGLGPVASPTPGSTEDLEARGTASRIAPAPIAKPSPLDAKIGADQSELIRKQSTGSGISQIKNPVARGALRTLDTIGTIAAPRITQAIPGTELHHQGLIGQDQRMLGGELTEKTAETGQAKTEADTEEAQARAQALRNPPEKQQTEGKVVTTDQGVMQWNPETQRYDIKVGGAATKAASTPLVAYTAAVQEAVKEGRDPNTDPKVQQLADAVTSVQPQHATPGEKAVTLQLPTGQKIPGKVNHEGNLLTADGQAAPQGTMLFQQPNYGQLVLPTKTVQVIGPDGLPTIMGWNEQTQSYDRPMGTSATGAYGHEMAQAGAVARGGEQLIQDIQNNREQLGTLSTWVKKYGLNTPIADPKLAELQSELATFAALQPAMHGFRSHSALETFESIIGGLQKNPDATIASIRGILQTTHAINPNQKIETGNKGAEPQRPANVPANYVFNASGPKGAGWYKP